MSWDFIVSIVFLLAAIVLIEVRAVRAGDERRRHAPGYVFVLGGLVLLGFGIAAAVTGEEAFALLLSAAGLACVAFGATRPIEAAAH